MYDGSKTFNFITLNFLGTTAFFFAYSMDQIQELRKQAELKFRKEKEELAQKELKQQVIIDDTLREINVMIDELRTVDSIDELNSRLDVLETMISSMKDHIDNLSIHQAKIIESISKTTKRLVVFGAKNNTASANILCKRIHDFFSKNTSSIIDKIDPIEIIDDGENETNSATALFANIKLEIDMYCTNDREIAEKMQRQEDLLVFKEQEITYSFTNDREIAEKMQLQEDLLVFKEQEIAPSYIKSSKPSYIKSSKTSTTKTEITHFKQNNDEKKTLKRSDEIIWWEELCDDDPSTSIKNTSSQIISSWKELCDEPVTSIVNKQESNTSIETATCVDTKPNSSDITVTKHYDAFPECELSEYEINYNNYNNYNNYEIDYNDFVEYNYGVDYTDFNYEADCNGEDT